MRSLQTPARGALSLAAIVLLTAGCAGMSKDECMAVDWRTIGYEDGVGGYSGDHIARYRTACAKYGVRTDLELYQEGRRQGLREYCRPVNGYRVGVGGGSYGGVCPVELEPPFIAAFENGHQLYILTARVSAAEAELAAKRRELDRLEHGIIASSVEAASSDASSDERAHAVLDAAQRAERVGQLRVEIRQLSEDRVRYQNELDAYQASHPPII